MESRGFGCTHVGGRENNEDSLLVSERLGLYVVADGMGGYEGGEVASDITVQALHRFYDIVGADGEVGMNTPGSGGRTVAEDMMRLAIRQASHDVEKLRHGRLSGMGSTVVSLLVRDGCALWAHVGDSRIYRMRRGYLEQVTRDHTLFAELLEAGVVSMRSVASRNMITRAIGVPGYSRPDVTIERAEPGDLFLLASDGLTDVIDDGEIADVLDDLEPRRAAETLVSRAYMAGSPDNITAVVVEIL